ncbi:MAG: tRNA-2-methylthio-N(6)-dimethylallyladenosine synthase [Candidatus Binatia bacterium]|nr:MAG: tRNA-2-methylthio-N(6)-dimethylallyladenosine synthase [Candidatus Binatia bacterium]
MSARVYIETYGCQMNLADSELVLGHLRRAGYVRASSPDEADVILLNTCAIREHAEERVLGRLGHFSRLKASRPGVQLGVLGCMAQHLREKLLDRIPFVDFVVGPDSYRRLPELLAGGVAAELRLGGEETYADIEPERAPGVRAWIPIMRGCDRFCTFCIVPYVRGRERSVPASAVLEQARRAAEAGYREVVLLGQTVNAYHDGEHDFAWLLRALDRLEGIERIRFTSPHPADMTDSAVEAMAECRHVCPQIHLPVQSGSDRVLERMERGYTVEDYLRLVEKLRTAVPGIALSTDVIVGFPGEEESDFEATRRLLETVRYDHAFLFRYSPRPGTKAYRWGDTVPEEVKAERLRQVIELQERISFEINQAEVGRVVEVLVEGPARRNPEQRSGKTPHFKTTVFEGKDASPGELVSVRVEKATAHTLVGRATRPLPTP